MVLPHPRRNPWSFSQRINTTSVVIFPPLFLSLKVVRVVLFSPSITFPLFILVHSSREREESRGWDSPDVVLVACVVPPTSVMDRAVSPGPLDHSSSFGPILAAGFYVLRLSSLCSLCLISCFLDSRVSFCLAFPCFSFFLLDTVLRISTFFAVLILQLS